MKKKPKRMFRADRVAPDTRKVVDEATADVMRSVEWIATDPASRAALREVAGAMMSPEVSWAYMQLSRAARSGVLVAMRDAYRQLRGGRTCDLCDRGATRIRPLVVRPGEDFRGVDVGDDNNGLLAFGLACDACNATPADAFNRGMLAKFAGLQGEPDHSPDVHPRPVVIGDRIGETGPLPPRAVLRDCMECSSPIWVDRDEQDYLSTVEGEIQFVCRRCAAGHAEAGRLDQIPASFLL